MSKEKRTLPKRELEKRLMNLSIKLEKIPQTEYSEISKNSYIFKEARKLLTYAEKNLDRRAKNDRKYIEKILFPTELKKAENFPRGLQATNIWPGAREYSEEMRRQREGGENIKTRYGGCKPLY